MTDFKIHSVFRFGEDELNTSGSLYLCETTKNHTTFLWPWKDRHVLSIDWNTLDADQMDIIFDCEWLDEIIVEEENFSLKDFLSGMICERS